MHFYFRSRSLAHHREGRGRIYRKIAGAVADKTFGIAGLPAGLDELFPSAEISLAMRASSQRRGHLART